MNRPLPGRRSRCGLHVAALAVLAGLTLLAGCETLRSMTPSARKVEATRVELQRLQARNMLFADEYVGRLLEAESRARPCAPGGSHAWPARSATTSVKRGNARDSSMMPTAPLKSANRRLTSTRSDAS